MLVQLLLYAVITLHIFVTGIAVYTVSIDTPHLYYNFLRYGRHAGVSGLLLRFLLRMEVLY